MVNLSVEATESTVKLSWTKSNDKSGIDHYNIYRSLVPLNKGILNQAEIFSTDDTFYLDN
jgi:hypothetical protein